VKAENKEIFETLTKEVGFTNLGNVKGKAMLIDGESFGTVAAAKDEFDSALENYLIKNN
jgi:hypothetical protein